MRTFLGILLAMVVLVVVLAGFGWLYFFNDGSQMGIGVNRNEAAQESQELVDSVAESVNQLGGEIDDVSGRDREESAEVVEANP